MGPAISSSAMATPISLPRPAVIAFAKLRQPQESSQPLPAAGNTAFRETAAQPRPAPCFFLLWLPSTRPAISSFPKITGFVRSTRAQESLRLLLVMADRSFQETADQLLPPQFVNRQLPSMSSATYSSVTIAEFAKSTRVPES